MLTNSIQFNGEESIKLNDSGVLVFHDANGNNTSTAFLNGGFDPTTTYTKTEANALLTTKLNVSGGTLTGAVKATTLSADTFYLGSVNFNELGIYTPFVPSGSSESYGVAGEYAADANYLYLCHAAGQWIRLSGETF